jgi:hypothetical protein
MHFLTKCIPLSLRSWINLFLRKRTGITNPDPKLFHAFSIGPQFREPTCRRKKLAERERHEIAKGVSACMTMMTSCMPMMSLRYWRSFMAGKLPPLRHRAGGRACKKGKYSIGIRGGGRGGEGGGGENMILQPAYPPLSSMYQGPIFQSRFDIFSVKKSAGRKGRCHRRCHLFKTHSHFHASAHTNLSPVERIPVCHIPYTGCHSILHNRNIAKTIIDSPNNIIHNNGSIDFLRCGNKNVHKNKSNALISSGTIHELS